MKKFLIAVALMFGIVSTASAGNIVRWGSTNQYAAPIVHLVGVGILGAFLSNSAKTPHQDEPLRLVTEAGKNYSFEVDGEEYHAHKDTYILVK